MRITDKPHPYRGRGLVSASENNQLPGQHTMVFLLGFKLSPESSTHMSVVWPPHSCALVQAIRPLGTSLLKGWEDTSAPLMAARSNRWAPNSPLNKQRRHCVEKQHSSNNKNMNKKQQQIGSKDQWGDTNENIHVNCAPISKSSRSKFYNFILMTLSTTSLIFITSLPT